MKMGLSATLSAALALALAVATGGALGGCSLASPPCKPQCKEGSVCENAVCVSRCKPACSAGTECDLLARCVPLVGDGGTVDAGADAHVSTDMAKGTSSTADMATVACTPNAAMPLKLSGTTMAPGGGLLSGDNCHVLYSDGANVHEVGTDGTGDTVIVTGADTTHTPLNTLVSPTTRSIVGLCTTAPNCVLHTFGTPAANDVPLLSSMSLAVGAFSSDEKLVVAAGSGGGSVKLYVGPPAGPFASPAAAPPVPWVQASHAGTVYALVYDASAMSNGMASIGTLTEYSVAKMAGTPVSSQVAVAQGTPAIVADGIYYSGLTNDSDIGDLRFHSTVSSTNDFDYEVKTQAHLGLSPSSDGMLVGFFASLMTLSPSYTFDVVTRSKMTPDLTSTSPVVGYAPSFNGDGSAVLYGDGCNANVCNLQVWTFAAGKATVLTTGNPYLALLLSASGDYAFVGDGSRIFKTDGTLVYTGSGSALAALRSNDGKRFAWIEMDVTTGMTSAHFFDETMPGAVSSDEVDAMGHTIVGEAKGGFLYTQTDTSTSLHEYLSASQSYAPIAPSVIGPPTATTPIDISLDQSFAVYTGGDSLLYIVQLH